MQERDNRIEMMLTDLPRPGKGFGIGVVVAAWFWMVFYDLIFVDYLTTPSTDYGSFRSLVLVLALIPMFIRILKPEEIENDQQAYQVFKQMTLTLLIAAGVLTLLWCLPFSYTQEKTPVSLWSFFVGRTMGLVLLLTIPTICEQLLLLYRYRSRRTVPKTALAFGYIWIGTFLFIQMSPILVRGIFDSIAVVTMSVTGILAVLALFLSARARWIVNLRKRQKLTLLGLSSAGAIAASIIVALGRSTEAGHAIFSFAPGVNTMTANLAAALVISQLAIWFHALIALPTADAIDRRTTEVSSLATFGRLLTRSFDIDALADTAISIACDVTAANAAWMEVADGEKSERLFGTSAKLPHQIADKLMSAATRDALPLAEAVRQRQTVEVLDNVAGARWALATGGETRQLRSVAAAPLKLGDAFLGTLYVAKQETHGFDREDLLILDAVADQVALSLEHARLIRSSIQRERFEQEMVIARELQQRLLPMHMPQSECFEIHAESQPASMVGGDYYDIVSFSDGTLGLIIADVSGKGASAALYMGMIKGIIQALSGSCYSPQELLGKINVALYGNIDQRWFATMTCAQIFEQERMLRVARAGHCPTLLVKEGKGSYSRPKGLGLAIARPILFEKNLEMEEIRFESGDYAIFLSDGLPEATAPDGEELGYERLLTIAETGSATCDSAKALRDIIFSDIFRFTRGEPPADDSTLAIIRWR